MSSQVKLSLLMLLLTVVGQTVGQENCCETGESSLAEWKSGCGGCGSFWNQPTITGDWFGARSALKESGVTFAGQSTHFAFGVNGGINPGLPIP
jgi:Na+(H+)/acetate symporter ActP